MATKIDSSAVDLRPYRRFTAPAPADTPPTERGIPVASAAGITLHSASREAYVDVSPHGIIAKLRLRTPPLGRRGKPVLDGIICWAELAAGTMGDRARVVNGNVYPLDPLSYPARLH